MKTKKLIELLQAEDPSGECEVCVGNTDIFFVECKPAYWDGCLEVLDRDESKQCYNVIGATYTSEGAKLNIVTHSIYDAMIDNVELPVKVIDTFVEKRMQKRVDAWRAEAKQINEEVQKDLRSLKNEN
jgi:hypothetical protein